MLLALVVQRFKAFLRARNEATDDDCDAERREVEEGERRRRRLVLRNLPPEVLREIFLFCDRKRLEKALKLVSRRFAEIVTSMDKYPYLVIDKIVISTKSRIMIKFSDPRAAILEGDVHWPKLIANVPSYLRFKEVNFWGIPSTFDYEHHFFHRLKKSWMGYPGATFVINCMLSAPHIIPLLLTDVAFTPVIKIFLYNWKGPYRVLGRSIFDFPAIQSCRELKFETHYNDLQYIDYGELVEWLHGNEGTVSHCTSVSSSERPTMTNRNPTPTLARCGRSFSTILQSPMPIPRPMMEGIRSEIVKSFLTDNGIRINGYNMFDEEASEAMPDEVTDVFNNRQTKECLEVTHRIGFLSIRRRMPQNEDETRQLPPPPTSTMSPRPPRRLRSNFPSSSSFP